MIEVFDQCAQCQRDQGNNIYTLYSTAMGVNDAKVIYQYSPFSADYSASHIKNKIKNQGSIKTTQLWFTFLYKLYVLFIQNKDAKKYLEIPQEAIDLLFGNGLLEAFKLKELDEYKTYTKSITK